MCPIGKRMIVVSAGVFMNLLLAAILFIGCFQVGVRFEAPVIGQIIPNSPASESIATDGTHLQPGDTVVSINDKPAFTFTDIQIAGAMSKPGEPVTLGIKRDGDDQILSFEMLPRSVSQKGLLEIGLYPASSLSIPEGQAGEEVTEYIGAAYPALSHLTSGSQLISINGAHVSTWADLDLAIQQSEGQSLITKWDTNNEIEHIDITPTPSFAQYYPVVTNDQLQTSEIGLLGLTPLPLIKKVVDGSFNHDILKAGDVIVRVADIEYPRQGQFRAYLSDLTTSTIPLGILRDGTYLELTAVLSSGKLGVLLTDAWELPIVAQPIQQTNQHGEAVPTVVAGKQILAGSKLISLDGHPIDNWFDFRKILVNSSDQLALRLQSPIANSKPNDFSLEISSANRNRIASLGWTTPLLPALFEPLYVVRSSGGNPLQAIKMGFDETVNMVVMTYLTIDRLLRRSVGVDQLRGPVGIIHIGSRIADRGMSYLLFFLAIISVNLAVLNFLPLPIVDGGLFLYLLYEKFRGKPPSIAFQNAAAMLGLGMIGILFVVTFYNDILRLIG
jgi:regulator of sigma E protease